MLRSLLYIVPFAFVTAATPSALAEQPAKVTDPAATIQRKPHDHAKWEKEISAYEAQDKQSPAPKGGIVFIGSSTVRLWKSLAKDFPQHQVLNRGFGGSEIADSTHFASRVILPYEPKMVFLRAGGNDINNGRSAEEVFDDFKAFAATIHKSLPKTKVVFISMTPTIARIKQVEENKKLNTLVKAYVDQHAETVGYVDVWDISLGADGQPMPSRFVPDGLHFSDEGYALLAERVRPHLPKP